MFDVIVNQAKKYSPAARKLEAKANSRVEQRDVIVIVQVRIECQRVKHVASFNVQR
jgi:hypothetical protein